MSAIARTLAVAAGFGALSTISVWVHLPGQTQRPNAFARGVYAPLTRAERALAGGMSAHALGSFRAAYARARMEGQPGVSERIRRRMGGVGKALLKSSPQRAWPFFESFALLSADFPGDAAAIEGFVLDATGGVQSSFTYGLMSGDGRTFWGTPLEVEWTGLWPIWKSLGGLSGTPPIRGIFMKAEPTWPASRFAVTVPLDFKTGQVPLPSYATLSGAPAGTSHVLYWDSNSSRDGYREGPGNWRLDTLLQTRWHFLWRVLLFSDTLPPRNGLRLTLHREYEPLDSIPPSPFPTHSLRLDP